MAITHAKVSAIADGADTSVVRPSDWNADHVLGELTNASVGITHLEFGTIANTEFRKWLKWHDNSFLSLKDGNNNWNAALILSELRIRSDGVDGTNNSGFCDADERVNSILTFRAMDKSVANGGINALHSVARLMGSDGATDPTFNIIWGVLENPLNCNAQILESARAVELNETTTPSAVADKGKVYTKSDNNLYFQDGAGIEHTVAFV